MAHGPHYHNGIRNAYSEDVPIPTAASNAVSIRTALEDTVKSIEELNVSVIELANRLHPVRIEIPSKEPNDTELSSAVSASPLADELRTINSRIANIRRYVDYILTSLDL